MQGLKTSTSYPTLAQMIFGGGKNHTPQYRGRTYSRQDEPGYMKKSWPISNPKVAANIEMMFAKWKPSTVLKVEANPASLSSLKIKTGLKRKALRYAAEQYAKQTQQTA